MSAGEIVRHLGDLVVTSFGGREAERVLVGAHVSETVRSKIITPTDFQPEILMLGMMAALLSAGTWLQLASRFGRPVSTTHSIVGAVFGFGLLVAGPASVNWGVIAKIVSSWFTSPLLAGVFAFLIFRSVQVLVLNALDPAKAAVRWSPLYAGLVLFVLTLVTIFKGLKNLHLNLPFRAAVGIAVAVGLTAAGVCRLMVGKILPKRPDSEAEYTMQPVSVIRGLADLVDRLGHLRDQAVGTVRDRVEHLHRDAATLHAEVGAEPG
ncbi:MAG: hypothetical protein GW880_00540 [Armatimonadetes bacterium]|nr:hypothetical protein [Armatimonadota bacterium]